MLNASDGYKAAITGDARRILLKSVIDIIDPDIVFGSGESVAAESFTSLEQLHDKELEQDSRYISLEQNRWLLDGSFVPLDDYQMDNAGFTGSELSGADGTFANAQWCEIRFSGVEILQACSVYFQNNAYDGFPVDFTIEIFQGGTAYHTETVKGNTEHHIDVKHFDVYYPDAIRVTVTRWSLPYRRCRIPEIIPGVYEIWDGDMIASFDITQQANIACTSIPYGSCTIKMDNLDRRFEPRSKDGVFQSIEARQGIDVNIGVELDDGAVDYKHVGTYYQYNGGWTTGDNGITMEWYLVDIIGLLADRQYIAPDTLPTTLEGWIASLVAQLGVNFEDRYHVDPDYAGTELTCTADDVASIKCGDLLRYVCMASGTWPRADNATGYLTAEPLWNQGNKLDLDNMETYPVMSANDAIAYVTFKLSDTESYTVSGNSQAASETMEVDNPFITTKEQALAAARLILSTMGGNKLVTTGRGDMISEIGDVDTVWLNESSATTGRRVSQNLSFDNGVLQGCESTLLQADGSFLWENRVKFTEDATWTVPDGVTQIRLILVGHGSSGEAGSDATFQITLTFEADGKTETVTCAPNIAAHVTPEQFATVTNKSVEVFSDMEVGKDGSGGKVWYSTVDVNPGMEIDIHIGQNEKKDPNTTAFQFSSGNGRVYEYGYTDVTNGDSYGRTGVNAPVDGSGDGGLGSKVKRAKTGIYTAYNSFDGTYSVGYDGGALSKAASGAKGCCIIYWDDPESELGENPELVISDTDMAESTE